MFSIKINITSDGVFGVRIDLSIADLLIVCLVSTMSNVLREKALNRYLTGRTNRLIKKFLYLELNALQGKHMYSMDQKVCQQ